MAGVAAGVGVLVVTSLLVVGVAAAGHASVLAARASTTADAAALAAADTASGARAGVPCERAVQVATRAGLALSSCEIDDAVATVSVDAQMGPFRVTARARAGPPGTF